MIKELVLCAAALSGYPAPTDRLPEVAYVTAEQVLRATRDPGAAAYYLDGVVHVQEGISRALFVHEIVHWLQDERFPGPPRRSMRGLHEMEAEAVQRHVVAGDCPA